MDRDIYKYENFRQWLKDLFEEKQKANPNYSQRQLARDAGVANPGLFNDVLKGRRTLSKDAAQKFSKAFGLNQREHEFFMLLVNFAQAKRQVDKDDYYQKILFRRSRSQFARINPELVKYYQDFRYPLVRTAIEANQFKGDYNELHRFIQVPIPFLELKRIVRDLCEWNLVKQNEEGFYELTEKYIEPPSTFNAQVRQLNKTWLEHGVKALDEIPADQRHISTMLLSVSKETSQKIKEKMESVRKEVLDWVEKDSKPEEVVQMSLVCFKRAGRES